ncbi:hypothetical protein [Frigoriglobus tundricola]|uniref:Uncharacterized protein n=1 Tax=Frigoriglobus tundricola TaxID=2774151 RepID=A0A6M5YJW9_9BACT|nr:hypothetical protein [Frigoriglobus tundricola]QJW93640.1 hypothetical protein FTUN_1148 [Frigoriglobus tundricola]
MGLMSVNICSTDDLATQTALLDALAALGARPEDDSPLDVPLPTGLSGFRVGFETLTVFVDAWCVDLEGPDELVRRVLAELNRAG